ncbi:class I SAM-dependent methyltransferase [Cellulomonas soli]|uniref:class I SAM-dependent methyltransferase n=1 Tax=Cellulomonas soli TaxID=931535 RepID=UPI003F853577
MSTFDQVKRAAWAGRAEAYAETFGPLCGRMVGPLLDTVGALTGAELLDAGTGPGAVAAVAITRGARVTAVDPDEGMRRLARLAAPEADVRDGALPDLDLADASFDVVAANFVLNMVGDPRAAARELVRLLRPGGRVAATVWPRPVSVLHQLWEDVTDAAGAQRPASAAPLEPAMDFARSPDGLAGLLEGAGLSDVRAERVEFVHRVDPDVWWSGPARGVATIGAVLLAQSPDVQVRMRREFDRLSRRYLVGGMLHLPTAAVLAHGTRAQ